VAISLRIVIHELRHEGSRSVTLAELSNGAISRGFNKEYPLTFALNLKPGVLAHAQPACHRVIQHQELPQRVFDHGDSIMVLLILSRIEKVNRAHWEHKDLIEIGKRVDLFPGRLSWVDKNG
jgi:hypothetical protein